VALTTASRRLASFDGVGLELREPRLML
jgi:hypothetical protein